MMWKKFYDLKQQTEGSLQDYYKRFKLQVKVVESVVGTFGLDEALLSNAEWTGNKNLLVLDLKNAAVKLKEKYLAYKFNKEDIWVPLRNNYRDKDNFIKACINKIDGLRILQFLHWKGDKYELNSEKNLFVFLNQFLKSPDNEDFIDSIEDFDYDNIDINSLKNIREIFFTNEMHQRKTQIRR